jgi:hypothetical protein
MQTHAASQSGQSMDQIRPTINIKEESNRWSRQSSLMGVSSKSEPYQYIPEQYLLALSHLSLESKSTPTPILRHTRRNLRHALKRLPALHPDRRTHRRRKAAIVTATRIRAPAVRALICDATSNFPSFPCAPAVFAGAGRNAIGVEFGVLV